MSPFIILTLLLLTSVYGHENQCGKQVTTVVNRTQEHKDLYVYFLVDKFDITADHLNITVDPANHEVTARRCERKSFKKFPHFQVSTVFATTIYKVSPLIDLDDVTAVQRSDGVVEIRAPYRKRQRKPSRSLEIARADEPYPKSSLSGGETLHDILFNFTSSGYNLEDFEVKVYTESYIDVRTDIFRKIEGGFTSSRAKKVELAKTVIAQYVVDKNVDLDEVTAVAYPNGVLGIDLPIAEINRKPKHEVEIVKSLDQKQNLLD